MHTRKSAFKVIVSSVLLLLFVAKITRTVFNPLKTQRINLILLTEGNDDQEGQAKKLEKNNVNFNEASDFLQFSLSNCLFCLTVSSFHQHYRINFFASNHSTVPGQPPDTLFA